jgi:SAM-dependent methyltransferase
MQPATVVGLQDETPASAPLPVPSRSEFATGIDRADAARYRALRHVRGCLDELNVAGRRVLEVGFGAGAEAELFVRGGARYSGLDIDQAAVDLAVARMKVRGLTYDALRHGDAGDLPWPSHSFDVVFAHGLLDRVDDVARVQAELQRVLLPGGQLVVMVRTRRSWHYQVRLRTLRRAGVIARYPLAAAVVRVGGPAGRRLAAARSDGLRGALDPDAFLDWGEQADRAPRRTYSKRELEAALTGFTVTRAHQHVAPVGPLSRWLGWHLWVHLTPREL